MARTKQTARKSTGGKAPKKLLACSSPSQFRQYMTSQQAATYQTSSSTPQEKTSYLNYENVFGSFGFPMGPNIRETFKPQFDAGYSINPISKQNEPWLSMKLKSKYDGSGMEKHPRPSLNILLVVDISGSMGSPMSNEQSSVESKLDAAKKCMIAVCDKFTKTDIVGLVAFDDRALAKQVLTKWGSVDTKKFKEKIDVLQPVGMTNLSLAYETASTMIQKAGEKKNDFSRIIFMTDLNSTVDSVKDEKDLLSRIMSNSKNNIYTTVVGIGMDFNVTLVQKISSTPGANYISASSGEEFVEVVGKDFNYNVTITAFKIKVELPKSQNSFELSKGYGSPEISNLKKKDQFSLSSEFASAQNENGEINGGVLLFRLKELNKAGKVLKIKVSFQDIYTSEMTALDLTVKVGDSVSDIALRKAIVLTHFVDLHNDYILAKKGVKHLERFQTFKRHFTDEMEDLGDKSLTQNNKAYLEMIEKIIELEQNSQKQPNTSSKVVRNPIVSSVFVPAIPATYPQIKVKKTKTLKRLSAQKGLKRLKVFKSPPKVKKIKKEPVKIKKEPVKIKKEPVKIKKEPVAVKNNKEPNSVPPVLASPRVTRTSGRKRSLPVKVTTAVKVTTPSAKKIKLSPKPKKVTFKLPSKKLTKPNTPKVPVRKLTGKRNTRSLTKS